MSFPARFQIRKIRARIIVKQKTNINTVLKKYKCNISIIREFSLRYLEGENSLCSTRRQQPQQPQPTTTTQTQHNLHPHMTGAGGVESWFLTKAPVLSLSFFSDRSVVVGLENGFVEHWAPVGDEFLPCPGEVSWKQNFSFQGFCFSFVFLLFFFFFFFFFFFLIFFFFLTLFSPFLFPAHTQGVTCCTINTQENILASGSLDQKVIIWYLNIVVRTQNVPAAHLVRPDFWVRFFFALA